MALFICHFEFNEIRSMRSFKLKKMKKKSSVMLEMISNNTGESTNSFSILSFDSSSCEDFEQLPFHLRSCESLDKLSFSCIEPKEQMIVNFSRMVPSSLNNLKILKIKNCILSSEFFNRLQKMHFV